MGYLNDTHVSIVIPPTLFHCVTGTWTMAAGPGRRHHRQEGQRRQPDQHGQHSRRDTVQLQRLRRAAISSRIEIDYE